MLQPSASKRISLPKRICLLSLLSVAILCACTDSSDTGDLAASAASPGAPSALSSQQPAPAYERPSAERERSPLFLDPATDDSRPLTADELLGAFLMREAVEGTGMLLGDEQIKASLIRRGLETLEAVRQRLASGDGLSTRGAEDDWQGSEEQLLLDVLLSLDLPGVETVALEWLQAAPSARAVAELGRYLGNRSPGLHDEQIRLSAEQALLEAARLDDVPGELFQLLGEYGDSRTVGLLSEMPWHRDAYASVALSLIPDGSGIEFLVRDARSFAEGEMTTHGRLAIELLAQQAYQDSTAAHVLLELAELGAIPLDLWPSVMAGIAGEESISLVRPPTGLQAIHTIVLPEGNQVLYRMIHSDLLDYGLESVELRMALLEALLDFAPSSTWPDQSSPGG